METREKIRLMSQSIEIENLIKEYKSLREFCLIFATPLNQTLLMNAKIDVSIIYLLNSEHLITQQGWRKEELVKDLKSFAENPMSGNAIVKLLKSIEE